MTANDPQRYIVRLEIFAAAGHVDIDADAAGDTNGQLDAVLHELAQADPTELEDRTYRMLRFDLCDTCRGELLRRPLG